jgi:hypothetical protein
MPPENNPALIAPRRKPKRNTRPEFHPHASCNEGRGSAPSGISAIGQMGRFGTSRLTGLSHREIRTQRRTALVSHKRPVMPNLRCALRKGRPNVIALSRALPTAADQCPPARAARFRSRGTGGSNLVPFGAESYKLDHRDQGPGARSERSAKGQEHGRAGVNFGTASCFPHRRTLNGPQ